MIADFDFAFGVVCAIGAAFRQSESGGMTRLLNARIAAS
ncbi:hypothetical protein JOE61_002339 [Nocardioides salarius]|uniref:Uncharacterized protein n=1 Tax=Nocardioides salarius TaxID=374513 RepID=A0ABS2MBF6_9ACTN|nr:hypothetical protein [Nocardioides salarius]